MGRTILALTVGGAVGLGVVFLLRSGSESFEPDRSILEYPGSNPERSTVRATPGLTSDALAIYERAANLSDPAELQRMILAAAAASPSLNRTIELEALLSRLAEIDPASAVDAGQTIRIEDRLFKALYQTWATVNADAALVRLSGISFPVTQHAIGLALVEVFGNDRSAIETVAVALPAPNRFAFKVDSLIAIATADPAEAFSAVLAEDSAISQRFLFSRLAAGLVEMEPRFALAQAERIEDADLRQFYRNAVISALGEAEPDVLLAFLQASDPRGPSVGYSAVLLGLARDNPELMLEFVDRLPPFARPDVLRAALLELAKTDPLAALSGLDSMPDGVDRSLLLRDIAQTYGEISPGEAIAWAESLSPPSIDAISGALRGIASVNFERALDQFVALAGRPGGSPIEGELASLVSTLMRSGEGNPETVVSALVEIEEDRGLSLLHPAMSSWAQTDYEAAINWALTNDDSLESQTVRMLAFQDPASAMAALYRVTPDRRADWIAGVAAGLAQSDPESAMSFIDEQRGQPGYEAGFNEVVRAWARVDPEQAARLVTEASELASPPQASPEIAGTWATTDPQAAASWAYTLNDQTLRADAVGRVATAWAERDVDEAHRWLLGLQNGPERDSGLSGVLRAGAADGVVDTQLLDAYSSDAARQHGMANALVELVLHDPDEARRLMRIHITNPEWRRMTESLLLMSERNGFAPTIVPFEDARQD